MIRKSLFILLSAFIILSCSSKYDPNNNDNSEIQEVFKLVNETRLKDGKSELKLDEKLNTAAAIRAKEIFTVFDHTRPDGTSCYTVQKEVPDCPRIFAENIARYQKTPQAVMEAWINSQGHYANIIGDYRYIGIGVYKYNDGKLYWVQLFR